MINYELERGFPSYVWEGNIMHQPKWWIELLNIVDSTKGKVRKAKMESKIGNDNGR